MNAGPPGPAVPPPAGHPGGLPVGYYSPHQPTTFPLYMHTGGSHPIQYQPGKYPAPQHSAPVVWMPMPTVMPNCPPGLEYLAQVLHTNPNYFLTKYDWGSNKKRLDRVDKGDGSVMTDVCETIGVVVLTSEM